MTTRNINLSNYGLTKDKSRRICKECKNNHVPQTIVFFACLESNSSLFKYLYSSLMLGESYDKLGFYESVPIAKPDFYGYKKKAIAIINDIYTSEK